MPAARALGRVYLTLRRPLLVSTGENRIRTFDEASAPCPTPNFGSGGGFDPSGGSSGGGGGSIAGQSGRVADTQPPRVSFSGFPRGRCARRDFAFMIHAADDVGISKLIVFVNRRRVASQPVAGHPTWNVRVNIPVRKVRRALSSGASVKVRIDATVVDVAGKKADAKRTFRICD